MTTQRHRIRRQILEVTVPHRSLAWQLQTELARIQARTLEALLDRCLSEIGSPDRLQRIDSLEINLGRISLADLEHDLVQKLGPALREALTARLREDDERAAGRSGDPEASARLELLAQFIQSGSLPWWADSSRPRLVDEAVAFLLERAPGPLLALVRPLVRSPGRLLRLVRHCTDERLLALFGALLASAQPELAAGLPDRVETLRLLLDAPQALPAIPAAHFHTSVWMGTLRAAGAEQTIFGGRVDFWREALAQVALAAGVTYASLLAGLREQLELRQPGSAPPVALRSVVSSLAGELRGEPVPSEPAAGPAEARATEPLPSQLITALRKLFQEAIARAAAAPEPAEAPLTADKVIPAADDELAALLALLEELASPEKALFAKLRAALPRILPAQRSALLPPLRALKQAQTGASDGTSGLGSAGPALLDELGAALDAALAEPVGEAPAHMQVASPQEAADELLAILARLERLPSPMPGLFPTLFSALFSALSSALSGQLQAALPEGKIAATRLASLLEPLRTLEEQTQSSRLGSLATLPTLRRLLELITAERWLSPTVLERAIALLRQAETEAHLREAALASRSKPKPESDARTTAEARAAAAEVQPPKIDLSFGDSDGVYVENAGLVLLWPFFIHLFQRLELMVDKKFRDPPSLHRAVGLLQHLVTGETEPAEYQLMLAKVLCGMEPTEVWNFGPPVTAAETEECENLLTAAIANAPVLGEMSIEGFRSSLLIRKGVLSSRDEAWLLRVERLDYDLVIERLPWSLSWVKLPWIAAPICVEW